MDWVSTLVFKIQQKKLSKGCLKGSLFLYLKTRLLVYFAQLKKPLKKTIGRIDKADFPELDLFDVAVKVDTGAYTSSIHCKNVKVEAGILKCNFLDKEHPAYDGKEFSFKDYKLKKVKSSNGIVQTRYMIQTTVRLFSENHTIQLTLSDREEMKFPVLLGRKFLNKKFIVDTGLTNLSFKQQTKK